MTESGPKPNYTVEVGMIWAPQWGEDYQTDGGEWRLLFASVFTQHCKHSPAWFFLSVIP